MVPTTLDPPPATTPDAPDREVHVSHYCRWDEPGGQLVRAVCGTLMRRREHQTQPTCVDCLRWLREHAELGF
jgi:hypothetical protein